MNSAFAPATWNNLLRKVMQLLAEQNETKPRAASVGLPEISFHNNIVFVDLGSAERSSRSISTAHTRLIEYLPFEYIQLSRKPCQLEARNTL